jgi:hypothetical protein
MKTFKYFDFNPYFNNTFHSTTRRHNPEELDLKIGRSENLKTRALSLFFSLSVRDQISHTK